jgi:hypothetical protein
LLVSKFNIRLDQIISHVYWHRLITVAAVPSAQSGTCSMKVKLLALTRHSVNFVSYSWPRVRRLPRAFRLSAGLHAGDHGALARWRYDYELRQKCVMATGLFRRRARVVPSE